MSAFLARHRWTFAAAALLAVVYGTWLSILPRNVFWVIDEGAKFFEIEACSLSWTGKLTYRIPFAGQRLLPGYEFLPDFGVFPDPRTVNGKLYLQFESPLAFPLLTAPLFHAFGVVGLYILPIVSGWLIALLTGLMASSFHPLLGPFAVVLVGFGTPVWFYSMLFWEHTLATLLGLSAVGLLVCAPRRVESIAATVPLILLASMFRIEVAALAPALVVAWVVVGVNARWRPAAEPNDAAHGQPPSRGGRWRLLLLSLVSTVAVCAFLNVLLIARHRSLLRVLPERIEGGVSGIANVPQAMLEVFIRSRNLDPQMGVAWSTMATAAVLLALVAPLIRSARAQAVMAFAAASIMLTCSVSLIVIAEPYRALHGLFPVAPFLIVWPFGLRNAWRQRNAPLLALGTAAWAYLLLGLVGLEVTYIWHGQLGVGMEWGQRYLLTAYPMLTVLALVGVRALATSSAPAGLRAASVTLVAVLAAAAICLELRGQWMLYSTRSLLTQWDQAMRSEDRPILTTVPWLAPTVAELFLTHDMFFTRPPGVAHWVEVAREHGITRFTLAEEEALTDEALGVIGVPWLHRVSEGTRTVTGGLHLTRFEIDPIPSP